MFNFSDINQINDVLSTHDYTLQITGNSVPLSVLSVSGEERLNQPWRYEITFTSGNKQLQAQALLTRAATFIFHPKPQLFPFSKKLSLSSLTLPALPRTLYGVITEFSQLAVNKQEAHYRVVLRSRLALLDLQHYSAIYQHQSVIAVVEQLLRKHGFTGVDYRLALSQSYPSREFITQWQESDLAFIQRILADIGVWFRFEIDTEHHCEVVVISDTEQGWAASSGIDYKQPSGMGDGSEVSVWDLQLQSKTVPELVQVQDYNYRQAGKTMLAQVNSQPEDRTTYGHQYRYGEHYKQQGDKEAVESGAWYAAIRHQQHISQQLIIKGKSNQYTLAPGQRVIINGAPLAHNISEGIIILSTHGQGNRTDSYEIEFTALPFNALKPYRPEVMCSPKISGTLPARITSPNNDTYGYLDTQGRYRVKFNFDLSQWKNGEESLWLRLAKPYTGEQYGFHFPLITGTEVAIAFTEGDPDRPYIAYALHDSCHPDHISTINKHRNVIRTAANNKLRMDDKRGEEHIKLATEYGKSQLNLGHLVDQKKRLRGQGFELRTDEWGAIRTAKGLFISTDGQPQANGQQLDMQQANQQLQQALELVSHLQQAAKQAKAELADLTAQKQLLTESLTELKEAALLFSSPKGMAQVTPKSIQLSAGENLIMTSQHHADINILKKFTLAAGEVISLFAQKFGIKLLAYHGNVDIQAQHDEMALMAGKDITISSQQGRVVISSPNELILNGGGAYIRLAGKNVEIGAEDKIENKTAVWKKTGPQSLSLLTNQQTNPNYMLKSQLRWQHDNSLVKNHKVRIVRADKTEIHTMTDDQGLLPPQHSLFVEPVTIIIEPAHPTGE
jgi:type VI secretion system secreted protein VgrG